MFTQAFVLERPSTSRLPKLNFGSATASCHMGPFPKYIVHGHTPTIYLDPQQMTPDVRENRRNVDTGAALNGYLSAAIFNDHQTKPIHTISVGAEN
jgi:hypothetical protein